MTKYRREMMRCSLGCLVVTVLALWVACSCHHEKNAEVPPNHEKVYKDLVYLMGEENLSLLERMEASDMLSAAGKGAIPVLISALDDKRIFDSTFVGPQADADATPSILTVGKKCELILYSIIGAGKTLDGPAYRVDDWNKWWEENKNKDIAEIRRMVIAWERQNRKK